MSHVFTKQRLLRKEITHVVSKSYEEACLRLYTILVKLKANCEEDHI